METILKTLSSIPAPSGSEKNISEAIRGFLTHLEVWTDAHGTLIAHKKGSGESTVILSAMDTPCFYITYVENDGFSRFNAVGGIKGEVGTAVLCENGAYGVIGADENGKFIDTGSISLAVGMWAVPVPSFYALDSDTVSGASMGQYAAMAAVLSCAMQSTTKDAYFVFGAKSYIRQFSPSFMQSFSASRLISTEVSEANDTPASKTVFASLGKGTTLRVKDETMLSSLSLIEALETSPYKTYREISSHRGIGGTLQKAYGGMESAAVGIPVRCFGAPCEIVSLKDIENTAALLSYMLQ